VSGDESYSYGYDGANNRIDAFRNGTITKYVYDASGNLLAEADAGNTITRYYIYGQGLLAMVTPADELYCYHFDAIGSTIAMTDDSQQVVNAYAYTPFGIITNKQEAIAQPFTFVGQHGVMTEPNGVYYMRARYYDPQNGRFISQDPLGFDGGDVNLYIYAANNPVLFSDPLGLWTFQAGLSFTSGGLFGSTKGGGLVIGWNPQNKEWQFGWYAVGGAGAYGGASASVVADFTWSGNENIEDVGGWATTAGGSGTLLGASVGGEMNTPLTGNAKRSYTFSAGAGVGTPGEGHGFATYTKVKRLGGPPKP
jgi:RHS repeat-associated protein